MSLYYKRNGSKVLVSDLIMTATGKMSGRRRVYRLAKGMDVSITSDGMSYSVAVPFGFETDLATVPTIAQLLIGNRDDPGVAEAAVVHDWLCKTDAPRELANTTMWWLMLATGVPRWKATAIYLALMVFGYKSPMSILWNRLKSWSPLEN